MQWPGSKYHLIKDLITIFNHFMPQDGYFLEPFLGGANVCGAFDYPKKIVGDIDADLIGLYHKLVDGWIPPTNVSREFFYDVKKNPQKYPVGTWAWIIGTCAYNGSHKGAYRKQEKLDFNKTAAGYFEAFKRRKLRGLQQCELIYNGDYRFIDTLQWLPASLIYCDPPYASANKPYRYLLGAEKEYDDFFQWARNKSAAGHVVLISEFAAPQDFALLKQWTIRYKDYKRGAKEYQEYLFLAPNNPNIDYERLEYRK